MVALVICGALSSAAAAQSPPVLVFTQTIPESSPSGDALPVGAVIGDRALALIGQRVFDPGAGVAVRLPGSLTVQSLTSGVSFLSGGSRYTSFQQIEILRPVLVGRSSSISAGGGIRQEWGGTRVLIGRVVGHASAAGGTLYAGGVLEKAFATGRDAADVITTVGWLHRVAAPLDIGVEGIGQDLEGFWEKDEAEGGARLLIGPAVHVSSADRRWSVSLAGGPMIRSRSTASAGASVDGVALPAAGHYAVLGTLTYVPRP